MVNRFYRGALARAQACGRPLGAYDGRRLVGVAIIYPAGSWPPSASSFFHEAWGVALSGPGPSVRGLLASVKIDAAHPATSHAFLHTLGIDPRTQRSGAGASLLERLIANADRAAVPVHLTTSTPDNLPYYRRFGFEIDGEATLPRGAPLWSMLRPAPR
jgi:ribosomal protein S18 acetylase RimI-like enzyme